MSRSDDTNCGSLPGNNQQRSPSTPSNCKRKTSFSPKFKKKQEEVVSSDPNKKRKEQSRAEKNKLMALEKLRVKKEMNKDLIKLFRFVLQIHKTRERLKWKDIGMI